MELLHVSKYGLAQTVSQPLRPDNLGMLELSYHYQTWHDDYCKRKVQFRKRGNSIIITKTFIFNMMIFQLSEDNFLYGSYDEMNCKLLIPWTMKYIVVEKSSNLLQLKDPVCNVCKLWT